MMASVIVPFLKMEEPFEALKELLEEFWDIWDENGKNKERIAEFIERMGKGEFVTAVNQEPIPEMVKTPRENPYIFYDEYFTEE
jgi:sulfite reductase alpha subunit